MNSKDFSFYFPGGSKGVLLIHGLTGAPAEMKIIGSRLAQAGFSVYGMQLAGHCGNQQDLLQTGWSDWYASVESAYARLKADCDVVFAAGLSMGAVLALHLAAQRPEALAGIGLYSTTLWHDGWSVGRAHPLLPLAAYLPFVSRLSVAERPPYGIKDQRIRQMIVSRMLNGDSGSAGLAGMPIGSLLELRRLTSTVRKEIPFIKTPTLIVHAREDDIASIRNVRHLERMLAGPVTTRILEDSYHMITVDRQRNLVADYSSRFFDKQNPHREKASPVFEAIYA